MVRPGLNKLKLAAASQVTHDCPTQMTAHLGSPKDLGDSATNAGLDANAAQKAPAVMQVVT
jgi:hypothetical protein